MYSEIEEAYYCQKLGLNIATTPSCLNSYPLNKGNYFMLIVNDEGLIIWG